MTTDLTRLQEAAEKAKAARRNLIANQDSQDAVNAFDQALEDWCELANPSTILALIARLREAEKALEALVKLNDDYSPFMGEMGRDRVERTWNRARKALKGQSDDRT